MAPAPSPTPPVCARLNRCVGDYLVGLTVPAGYISMMPINVTTTVTSSVTSQVRYGIQGLGALVAFKFEDRNGNGVQNAGEPPLDGVTINFTGVLTSGAGSTANGGSRNLARHPRGAIQC